MRNAHTAGGSADCRWAARATKCELTKCEHLMSDLVNQMFDALNYTHKHTTSRVLMINQHEPLPPAHCIPEEPHPCIPHAVVRHIYSRQRATDQGRRKHLCAPWPEVIVAQIELQTRADVQPTVSKCNAHAACEGGAEADKGSRAGGQRTDVSEALTAQKAEIAFAPSAPIPLSLIASSCNLLTLLSLSALPSAVAPSSPRRL